MLRKASAYEIIIPVSIKDQTKAGAKSVNSSVDNMARQAQRDAEKVEKANLSAFERRVKAIEKMEVDSVRRREQNLRTEQRAIENSEKAKLSAFQTRIRSIDRMEASSTGFRERTIREQQRLTDKAERDNLSAFQKRINAVDRAEQSSNRFREQNLRNQQRAFEKAEAAKLKAAQQAAADYESSQEQMWTRIRNVALAAVVAIGVGIAGMFVAINRAATFQRLEMGLAAVSGSAAEAEKQIARLKEVAKVPGLGFREAIQGSLGLQAVGFSAERAEKALIAFGNAVAFTGGKAELQRIMLQITQMASAGKVLTQDLRPVIQTAPIAARALKEVFGSISPEEINKQVSSVDEFIDRWVEGLLKLAKAPNAAANSFENLSDSWDRFLIALGKPFLPLVQATLGVLAPALETAGTAVGALIGIIAGYPGPIGLATAALMAFSLAVLFASTSAFPAMIAAFGTSIQMLISFAATLKLVGQVMIGTASLIQGATATMAVATLGWGALVLVLGAVVYALTKTSSAIEKAEQITADSIQAQQESIKTNKELMVAANEVSRSQADSAEKHQRLNVILGQLDPITRTYVEALRTEQERLAAVNVELEKNVNLNRSVLEAELRVVTAAVVAQQQQIEIQKRVIVHNQEYIQQKEKFINLDRLWSTEIITASESLKELAKGLTDNQAKMVSLGKALGMNNEQFLQFLKTTDLTGDEIDKLSSLYDLLKPKVEGVNGALKEQARDLSAIQDQLKGLLSLGAADVEQRILDITRTARTAAEARKMAEDAKKQIIGTAGTRFGSGQATLEDILNQRRGYTEAEKAAREVFEPKPISRTDIDRRNAEQELINSMREFGADLADAFKEEFGRELNIRVGQTAFHAKKLGLDHRAAIDIPGLDIRTAEGRFVKEFAEAAGIKAWFAPGAMTRDGRVISTGKHAHLGEFSRGLGKPMRLPQGLQSEGLLSAKGLERYLEEESLVFAPWSGQMISQAEYTKQRAQFAGEARKKAPLGTMIEFDPDAVKLPIEMERQWDNYYKQVEAGEEALRDRRADYATEYAATQRNMITEIGNLELDLRHLRQQNADDQFTEQRRLLMAKQEELALNRRLTEAEDELANSDLNQSLRVQLALIQDLTAIRRRDEEALKDYNQAMLEMADATVYHSQQADTAVARFLASQKSVTDIVVDAKIGVMEVTFDLIDRGLSKVTDKLGIMKDLVHEILSGFIRLALSQFFKSVFLGQGQNQGGGGILGGGGGGGSGGGGIFGAITSAVRGIFTGGRGSSAAVTGGFAGGPGAAGVGNGATGTANWAASLFGGSFGGGNAVTAPPSVSGGSVWSRFGNMIGFPGASSAAAPGALGKLGASFGPMLPLLGLGIGTQAGGASRFGSILGGAGGLLAGGIGAAFLAPGLFATTGILGSMGPAIAGLLTNPFTAIAAVALIAGALIFGRNAQRKKDEKTRNQATLDTGSALWAILRSVQTDQMDGPTARAEIEKLHQNWIAVGNSLKDSKTRRHHMDTWNHFAPIIGYIETAIGQQASRANIRGRMSPVFAGGGYNQVSQLIRVRPGEGIKYPGSDSVVPIRGRDLGYDSQYMFAPKGAQIINQSDMRSSKGYQSGGTVGSDSSGELPELHIDSLELNIDADGMADLVISSRQFKKAVIHNVKVAKKEKKLA